MNCYLSWNRLNHLMIRNKPNPGIGCGGVIPEFGRLKEEQLLEGSLNYIRRPCLTRQNITRSTLNIFNKVFT